MRPPNGTIIVHRKHFLDLRAGESFRVGTFTIHGCARVGPSYALRLPPGGSLLCAQYQQASRGVGGQDDDHAELKAVNTVVDKTQLAGASVYTTLEPCTRHVRRSTTESC